MRLPICESTGMNGTTALFIGWSALRTNANKLLSIDMVGLSCDHRSVFLSVI